MEFSKFTPQQMNTVRNVFHSLNRFMVLWKIGWGKIIHIWPAGIGRIMVIKHRGRKSGKEYLTPANDATVDGEVYCMVGFVAPLFGINPRKLNDKQLDAVSKEYRRVHFRKEN